MSEVSDTARQLGPRARVGGAVAVVALAWALALATRALPAAVTERWWSALPRNPWVVPAHALRLYVLLPLGLLSNFVVWLGPGLLLALAFGRVRRASEWLVLAFAVSYGAQALLAELAKRVGGLPLADGALLVAAGLGTAACAGLALWRAPRALGEGGPLATRADRGRLALFAALTWVALAALVPITFWQDLNDDGMEALFLGRALAEHHLPRWPTTSGLVGLGVGMFAQAFPAHWFVAWYGPIEAAPRLPFFLALPVVLAALVELIELGAPRVMRAGELAALTLALCTFAVVMAFDAGYDPYFCELSSPGAFELLLMAFVLGGIWALFARRRAVFLWLALLAHLGRPSGILIFGLLGIGALLFDRAERRAWLRPLLGAGVLMVLVSALHERVYVPWVLGEGALGYDAGSALDRFDFLTLTDWRRPLWLVVPSGILPAVALVLFRRQDGRTRALSFLCLAYLGFFYVPAFVSLHHYAPLMVLPPVVMWRLHLAGRSGSGRVLVPAALAGAALALWISSPPRFDVNRTMRELGARIADERPNRAPTKPGVRERASALALLAPAEDGVYFRPERVYVGSPYNLSHYCVPGPPGEAQLFWLRGANREVPEGWRVLFKDEGGASQLLMRSIDGWPVVPPPPTDFAAPLYRIRREVLFRHLGIPAGAYDVALRRWLLGY